MMRIFSVMILLAGWPVSAAQAQAQITPPPVPSIVAPPAAPPPPRIDVPDVPKMDAPPKSPKASPSRRSSFNDRVLNCLDDSYAARLAPGDRVAYSRSCANRTD